MKRFIHIPKTAGRTITDISNEESKRKGKKLYVGEKYFMEIIIKKNKFYFDTFTFGNGLGVCK